jgi:hypothetical protein
VAFFLFNYDQELRFSRRLQQAEHLRVLFYLHFGAIVWHVAQLTQLYDQKLPRYLSFTGRGSLYLRLLAASDTEIGPVNDVARVILRAVTGIEPPANFEVRLEKDPKQATANGGVLADVAAKPAPDLAKPVGRAVRDDTREHHLQPTAIDGTVKDAVLTNVRACLKLLLTDPALVKLQRELGIRNAPGLVMETLEKHLENSFDQNRKFYLDTLPPGEEVPETLFFLPLKEALYQLSKTLHGATTQPDAGV